MRWSRRGGPKEQEIAGRQIGDPHPSPGMELVLRVAGKRHPVSAEHVLRESTAVEPFLRRSTLPIGSTAEVQRSFEQRRDHIPRGIRRRVIVLCGCRAWIGAFNPR